MSIFLTELVGGLILTLVNIRPLFIYAERIGSVDIRKVAQDPTPRLSDCPPMPAPITVGAAVDVFVGGMGTNSVYRIPAIARTGSRLLAFAEGRAALGDIGTNDLVLAMSDDGGASWSPPRTVLDLPDRSINNPCVVTLHAGPHAG